MKNIHLSVLFAALFFINAQFTTSAHADKIGSRMGYYSTELYEKIEAGEKDKALKAHLFQVLSSAHIQHGNNPDSISESCEKGATDCYRHTPISYNEARKVLLGKLELLQDKGQYALYDAYCEKMFTQKDFGGMQGPKPDTIPEHSVFNVEHTWPQSRFSSKFPKFFQKGDLNILYGVSTLANSSRQNLEFADVQTEQSPVCPAVRRGWVRGNSGAVFFEPPDHHKGNVARAIFYFSTRYQLPISEVEETSLRRWHQLDPVDQAERTRLDAIFEIQKVRNPYIDHPELVDLISDF